MKVYERIARLLDAIERGMSSGREGWVSDNEAWLAEVMGTAPKGGGIDAGVHLREESTPQRILLQADFHHMNENGYYDGWTEHVVKVTPSLGFGIDVKITGRDRNMIKDYLHELFYTWLTTEYGS